MREFRLCTEHAIINPAFLIGVRQLQKPTQHQPKYASLINTIFNCINLDNMQLFAHNVAQREAVQAVTKAPDCFANLRNFADPLLLKRHMLNPVFRGLSASAIIPKKLLLGQTLNQVSGSGFQRSKRKTAAGYAATLSGGNSRRLKSLSSCTKAGLASLGSHKEEQCQPHRLHPSHP